VGIVETAILPFSTLFRGKRRENPPKCLEEKKEEGICPSTSEKDSMRSSARSTTINRERKKNMIKKGGSLSIS